MFGTVKYNIARVALTVVMMGAGASWAQERYPNKTVEIVVPWTAGQATDIAARALANELSEKLGKTFFISNKAGAGGVVGSAYVARAKSDGYTLLAASTGSVIISPFLNDTSYGASDFVPAAMIAKSPSVLVTAADFPAKNINELIQLLKENPGKYTFASSGNGSATHLMAESFNLGNGIQAVHVPYKGSSTALTDVQSGRVTYMFDTVASIAGLLKSGKIRAYGISSKERSASIPDVPTIAEVTELKDFDIASWIGLMAPKGASPETLAVIEKAAQEYLQTPDAKARYQGMGLGINPISNSEFQKVVDREVALYSDLLKKLELSK
ncbi:Bug family tripartite tricarboxylate transporter substrate binding protein [Advenella mimigardefordensis]|uniref:Putative Bug-like extracytoplasmic solute binding receptor, TTT family n=1 Tax=Advenella mimigardefordensis (strain DSM 17166 / LMG 22922 / DPN7) TaxID=1247726 RepID=W0PF34_ADVMD|nr:tripartite tricarboxylate transporter substrate binding protein [Advenella mimigardefordensis]AHG65251.1 putative Bug-like extracytoplasmic solute binding receptor, TTT family [Advenella mimigardefordensis DPN7]